MKIIHRYLISLVLNALLFLSSKKGESNPGSKPVSDPVLPKINVIIDKTTKYQPIDGFGFFGGADVWWSGSSLIL